MKNRSKAFFVAFYLCTLAAAPLRAQTNSETGMTNAMVTNAVATAAVAKPQYAPSPRIDIPGVHIDGMDSQGEAFTRALALMIPIVAIVMGCSIPIVIVSLSLMVRHRKNKMLHETVRAMVEKGVPIPPEMFKKTEHEFMEHDSDKRPRNDFRKGLIFIGIGVGLVMLAGKVGYIILFIGVAFLAASFFEKKSDNQPPKP